MIYAFIRLWAKIFLRSYFRKTIVYGVENIPSKGPLIVASNHPSAFLEASILATVMNRPIHFLVRGDMFHPKFRWLFNWTKQIPIYRQKDGISNLRKNASSFDLTYRKLSEGEAVLIFPEAKTILEKKMRPIQRGTAHLAFGTLPFLKNDQALAIQPVGVNFTEPRIPGTDIVIKFGDPYISQTATREERDAIEQFTEKLSLVMSPLIIQVEESLEKNYDLIASIYFRLIYENRLKSDAHKDLQIIAATLNDHSVHGSLRDHSGSVVKTLGQFKIKDVTYFPDLIVLNKVGLGMLALLKSIWWIAGGWLWRLARSIVFKQIKTKTFQGPTTVGVFMVLMPLAVIFLLIIFLIFKVPAYYVLIWLLIMWLGTLIRPPIHVVYGLVLLKGKVKSGLKQKILMLRKELETMLHH